MWILNNIGKPCPNPLIKPIILSAYVIKKMFLEFFTASFCRGFNVKTAPKVECAFLCSSRIKIYAVITTSPFAMQPHNTYIFLLALFERNKFVGVIVEECAFCP